jgi:hypothetical protein
MAGERISFRAVVKHEVGPMACITHNRDFGLRGDRKTPIANGVGGKLARLARGLTYALDAQRRRVADREIASLLSRSGGRITDSMEREIMEKALASDWSLPQ